MAENSKIEWTTHTFNPWRGCTKVSPGCTNCYADKLSHRNPKTLGIWGPKGTRVVAAEAAWREPLKWDAAAKAAGERHRVFCASLADVFEGRDTMPPGSADVIDAARARLFVTIDRTPNLDWLLLTKRPENIGRMWHSQAGVDADGRQWGKCEPTGRRFRRHNVWLGTSTEDQERADKRLPHLIQCRDLAPVLFISAEPLLGPVTLSGWDGKLQREWLTDKTGRGIDWVIVGGESGPGSRPMHRMWARSLRDQCQAVGVPFFFKQWGEYGLVQLGNVRFTPVPSGVPMDEPAAMFKVGKKEAGRLLDGRVWSEFPAFAGV